MSEPVRLVLASDFDELPRVVAAVDAFVREHALDARTAYSLHLVLEEMLTNAVKYGRADGIPHPIEVNLAIEEGAISVEIEHDGDEFDPTAAPAPTLGNSLESRPIGGLGLHLVRQVSERMSYERIGERNRVRVWVRTP